MGNASVGQRSAGRSVGPSGREGRGATGFGLGWAGQGGLLVVRWAAVEAAAAQPMIGWETLGQRESGPGQQPGQADRQVTGMYVGR